MDRISTRYNASVQFPEIWVRQWTRLFVWPLFSLRFLRQQTSHIQQVHPSSGDLDSFVLSIHKWVPLLLLYEVLPQGKILAQLLSKHPKPYFFHSSYVISSHFNDSISVKFLKNNWNHDQHRIYRTCLSKRCIEIQKNKKNTYLPPFSKILKRTKNPYHQIQQWYNT